LNTRTHRRGTWGRFAVVGVAIAAGAVPTIAEAKPVKVDVMTRNLYLGAVLDPIIAADTPGEARTAAGDVYKIVQDTNYTARVKLLAQEIENSGPDLIGLQEVALWRRGQRGAADGATTPSQEVVYDYLELLQDELDRRGLKYKVASLQQEADIEAPISISGDDAAEFDVRLTMRDVILVKKGIETSNPQQANYTARLNVPVQGAGTVTVLRGYNAIDVKFKQSKKRKQKFQFVNTHLESFFAGTRNNQANELVSEAGPLSTELPVILLGDLNSDPADPAPASTAYNKIVGDEYAEDGGFADLGLEENTCCWSETLFDPPPAVFTSRIDHVLGRGEVSEVSSALIGDDPALRTDTGLWPTDHGGVVARLKVG
jgi:endonuclease/exonuclease/phosphatase family metal-dependent hydrolase